ncbi:hypothetical protein [uncultured Corynebacterium sp.]|uniref:hypothetical protein n=1 Tax=uncultured Corynebacterium sp. TaxID=159447 RepID=UPI00260E2D9B|nr:hypothetical protein [uncultured Corynebacterium sp.]
MKKSERDRPAGLIVRVRDGKYIMGDLSAYVRLDSGMEIDGVYVTNRWGEDYLPGWAVGPNDRTKQIWIEERNEQVESGAQLVRRVRYVVFPDFRIREEKLAPVVNKLQMAGVREIQYLAIRQALGM